MPRRCPAPIRGGLAPRRPAAFTVVDGLDAVARLDVRAFEQARLTPGAVAKPLRSRRQQVRLSRRYVTDMTPCGCPCCCDAGHGRTELELALRTLPRRSARQLHSLIDPLDDTFLARTLPDPHLPEDLPWWERRC